MLVTLKAEGLTEAVDVGAPREGLTVAVAVAVAVAAKLAGILLPLPLLADAVAVWLTVLSNETFRSAISPPLSFSSFASPDPPYM